MDVSLSGLSNVQVNQPGWTQKQHKNTINSEPPTYHRLINDLLEVERMPPYTFLIKNWDCRNMWAYSNHIRETRPNNLSDILDQGKGVTPPSGLHKLMNSYQGDSMVPHPSVIWYEVGLCQEKRTLNYPEVSVQLWPSIDRLEVCLLFYLLTHLDLDLKVLLWTQFCPIASTEAASSSSWSEFIILSIRTTHEFLLNSAAVSLTWIHCTAPIN